MGLTNSRPPTDAVYAHLRDQTRLIADLQTYLNRVDKLLADSEAAHKGIRRAVEAFFPPDEPSHDAVFKLMYSMKIFEQARIDLRPQTTHARRTFRTLLDKAHHLERLVKERDKLSKKVEAHERNLEKLRSKNSIRPTPALQKRLTKAEGQYNAVIRQFKLKDMETQLEATSAMDGRYAEAATVVSQCLSVIVQYVLMTAPEMEKANALLAPLQQSAGGTQTTHFRPLISTPGPPATAPVCATQQPDHQPIGADLLGDPSQNVYQENQQPSIAISLTERMEEHSLGQREVPREPSEGINQQAQPVASTPTPSVDVSPRLCVTAEKDNFVAPSVESSGQTRVGCASRPGNPFENDL